MLLRYPGVRYLILVLVVVAVLEVVAIELVLEVIIGISTSNKLYNIQSGFPI